MFAEKSAQVRNHFEGVVSYVDTKNSIGDICIAVAAPTSSSDGVELAVDESNIGGSSRMSRGQTSDLRGQARDYWRALACDSIRDIRAVKPPDKDRPAPAHSHMPWHRLCPPSSASAKKQTVRSEVQPAGSFESGGNYGPAGSNRRSLG
jgi:hypothetical protein